MRNSPTSTMAATKSTPKDAQVMGAILKDMGVNEYEPRLINQMLEFTYRYVTDVLDDAKIYSQHGNKKNIDTDDVKLAIQCKLDHSFTTPPPRDLLMDIARHKNNTPLPLIKPYTGPKLPPDRYCLSQPNYRLRTLKKPRIQLGGTTILPSLASSQRISLSQSGVSAITKPGGITTVGGTSLTLVTRGVTQPTVTIRPAGTSSASHSAPPVPIIRLTPGSSLSQGPKPIQTLTKSMIPTTVDVNSLKRKRDGDEDDYDKM